MRVEIISGKDKGKQGIILKYVGDEVFRILLDNGFRTLVYDGEFKRV